MICPVCKTPTLIAHDLDQNLVSQRCTTCGGQWINSFQFWKWLEEHRATPHEVAAARTIDLPTSETKGVKVCPECGRILAKYKVGHSLGFSLDRCGNCGGSWFDRNEWEILQSGDLRDQIHLIFSDTWQHRVRDQERARHLQELFAQRVGEKDFAEIRRIKEWLNQHPQRQELFGYL